MDKKSIIHLMTKTRIKSSHFKDDINLLEDVSRKFWVKNVIFYKGEKIDYSDWISSLEKVWIFFKNYSNKHDLKKQSSELSNKYEVIYVNTSMELLVNTSNEIKDYLWIVNTQNPDIFRDKSLQRELIQNYNSKLGVKFIKWEPWNLDIKKIEKYIWYPFIVKPIDWVQSAWVEKINNNEDFNKYIVNYGEFHSRLKSRWVDNKELIIEEFVDGVLYSIDYFVSKDWNVIISKPVKVELGIDLSIEDYFNFARIVSNKVEDEFKWKRLKSFVNSTVKACWIKNTFIHHEFKINSKWELKTIELNWRLWWWRLDIINKSYGVNMYEFICDENKKLWKLINNIITIKVYSIDRWILKWFNDKLFDKIKSKETVYNIVMNKKFIWKEVWLTRDWFTNVASIKLMSKDYKLLNNDYSYIKSHFKELLIIESS